MIQAEKNTFQNEGNLIWNIEADQKISILGEDPRNGLFDTSIEYGDDGVGWLAYSRVTLPEYVETHIAKSVDKGRTWRYVTAANRSTKGSLIVAGKKVKGIWRYETPTLVYDRSDIPARRWKIFVQRYLSTPPHKKKNSLFQHSQIQYRYAATPSGPWSKPICMFGKSKNNCRVNLNSLHPNWKGNKFYNELGSIVVNGVIYISLDASTTSSGLGEWKRRKIVLISSRNHGRNWKFAGILTNYNDANALGYLVLTGSSLVKENGRLFLLTTPSGRKGFFRKNRGHNGTLAVEFANISGAKLKRDKKGKLIFRKFIKPNLTSGGLSDYDEKNTAGGMLFSQINVKTPPEVFQIFNTKQWIIP